MQGTDLDDRFLKKVDNGEITQKELDSIMDKGRVDIENVIKSEFLETDDAWIRKDSDYAKILNDVKDEGLKIQSLSAMSNSIYTEYMGNKIRISDHNLPSHYTNTANYEIITDGFDSYNSYYRDDLMKQIHEVLDEIKET